MRLDLSDERALVGAPHSGDTPDHFKVPDRGSANPTALAGMVLRHNNPLWDQIYPPNGWKRSRHVVTVCM